MAGEWVIGYFGGPGEDHHYFPPHNMGQQFWDVGERFAVCFKHPGGWTRRDVHPSIEARESHKYPSHQPRVPSTLKHFHNLCLIGPRCWNLLFSGTIMGLYLLRYEFADRYLISVDRRHCAVVNWWDKLLGGVV